MSRKILLGGILVALLAAIIFGIAIIRSRSYTAQNPLRAIPKDAVLIMRINNYQGLIVELNQRNLVWKELAKSTFLQETGEMIQQLDSAFLSHEALREAIKGESYYSLHFEGDRKIGALYTFALTKTLSSKKTIQLLEIAGINVKEVHSRKYEGKEIKEITYINNGIKNILSFSLTDGLLLISKSSLILEDALRQLTVPNSLFEDVDFTHALQTSGKNKLANIFVNPNTFNKTLSNLFNVHYATIISDGVTLDNWIQLDVNLISDNILLNGFAHESDTIISQLGIFYPLSPGVLSADKVLPSSTSMLLSFIVDDHELCYDRYKDYLNSVNRLNKYQMSLNKINDSYKLKFVETISAITDNEISIGNITNEEKGGEINQLVLFKVKSARGAEDKILEALKKIALVNNVSINTYIYKYYLDNERAYRIYKMPIKNFTGIVLGDLFNCFDNQYFTFIDNFLVLAGSKQVLSETIHQFELNKTLITNESYQEFKKSISAKSNILFYISLNNSGNFLGKYLDEKIMNEWQNNKEVFNKVRSFGFQLGEVGQLPYCNLSLKHYSVFREKPHTVWQSLLDTTIRFKPQFVINHYTKEKEIFLQDEKNNIYLISKAGTKIWKIPLTEKINSDIFQIDYYKNNKLQLLFSTENYIHLIDRNGNYVERYPVRLRSPATSGISMFDYEGNKNYRFFIACSDKQVYAYSKDGSLIKGWQFEGTDHKVYTVPRHFKIADKDFIVFGDKYRIYILDRRGNTRVPVNEIFSKSEKNEYILENNGTVTNSKIVTTDTSGMIYKIYFDGTVEKNKIKTFSPEHFFDYKDMDADGKNEYIFLDRNILEVYNQKKEKIIEYKFNTNITSEPLYFYFSYTDRKLGFVSEEENKIYLINNEGSLYEGFPLTGGTLFSIGFLDNSPQFNLIVGNDDHFLLNYTVQ